MVDFDRADQMFYESVVPHPNATIPLGIIAVVAWMDDDGFRQWKTVTLADMPVVEIVGLLEVAKLEVLSRNCPETFRGDDPDEV